MKNIDITKIELDHIIVLGALMRENGPSLTLQMRLDTAIDYLKKHPNTIAILSGGQCAKDEINESLGMEQYFIQHGIPKAQFLLESHATNTRENMKFSRNFYDPTEYNIGIVTSDFHMFRSICIARKEGYQHVYKICAPSPREVFYKNVTRELVAFSKDLICGNLKLF